MSWDPALVQRSADELCTIRSLPPMHISTPIMKSQPSSSPSPQGSQPRPSFPWSTGDPRSLSVTSESQSKDDGESSDGVPVIVVSEPWSTEKKPIKLTVVRVQPHEADLVVLTCPLRRLLRQVQDCHPRDLVDSLPLGAPGGRLLRLRNSRLREELRADDRCIHHAVSLLDMVTPLYGAGDLERRGAVRYISIMVIYNYHRDTIGLDSATVLSIPRTHIRSSSIPSALSPSVKRKSHTTPLGAKRDTNGRKLASGTPSDSFDVKYRDSLAVVERLLSRPVTVSVKDKTQDSQRVLPELKPLLLRTSATVIFDEEKPGRPVPSNSPNTVVSRRSSTSSQVKTTDSTSVSSSSLRSPEAYSRVQPFEELTWAYKEIFSLRSRIDAAEDATRKSESALRDATRSCREKFYRVEDTNDSMVLTEMLEDVKQRWLSDRIEVKKIIEHVEDLQFENAMLRKALDSKKADSADDPASEEADKTLTDEHLLEDLVEVRDPKDVANDDEESDAIEAAFDFSGTEEAVSVSTTAVPEERGSLHQQGILVVNRSDEGGFKAPSVDSGTESSPHWLSLWSLEPSRNVTAWKESQEISIPASRAARGKQSLQRVDDGRVRRTLIPNGAVAKKGVISKRAGSRISSVLMEKCQTSNDLLDEIYAGNAFCDNRRPVDAFFMGESVRVHALV